MEGNEKTGLQPLSPSPSQRRNVLAGLSTLYATHDHRIKNFFQLRPTRFLRFLRCGISHPADPKTAGLLVKDFTSSML